MMNRVVWQKLIAVSLSALLFCLGVGSGLAAADGTGAVRAIDWSRFHQPTAPDPDREACGRMLLNEVRYCAGWAATYREGPRHDRYVIATNDEPSNVRMPACAAYGMAVALKAGLFDERAVGINRAELARRTRLLIKGVASAHKANPGGTWGERWQSPMIAGMTGHAGWMMWDDLDAECRDMVLKMILFEADRHLRPDYTVPYWNGKDGDTKAEENAWETFVLQVAVAMLPEDARAARWRRICCELMISAFSRPSDMKRKDVKIDGRAPSEWLKGYNIFENGTLVNHNLIHDDYMTAISHNMMRSVLVCSLAGIPAPEAFDFNFDVVYRAFANVQFPSPPYKAPGGSMYLPGKPEVYYPQGNDWGRCRFDIFYLMDAYACALGHPKELRERAGEWMRVRTEKILAMQARHADGRMYAKGEFDTFDGREQMTVWLFADAYLLKWLKAQGVLSGKKAWIQ